MNLEPLKVGFSPNLGSLILGLISATGLTWITTYATITLYNSFKR